MHAPNEFMLEQEVESAFAEMGLDPLKLFESTLPENPYREHHWVVRRTPSRIVVSAMPDEEDLDHLFWEEWHTHHGQVHHQIMSQWQPVRYDGILHAPPRDDDHPRVAAGKRWFVIDDDEMKPLLLCR